jgi:hypothetical protein
MCEDCFGSVVQRDRIQIQFRNMDKTGRLDALALVLLGEGRLPSVRLFRAGPLAKLYCSREKLQMRMPTTECLSMWN